MSETAHGWYMVKQQAGQPDSQEYQHSGDPQWHTPLRKLQALVASLDRFSVITHMPVYT